MAGTHTGSQLAPTLLILFEARSHAQHETKYPYSDGRPDDAVRARRIRPPLTKTPHLTRSRKQGVVFDSAYCASPLCAPSRFSFLVGQAAFRNRRLRQCRRVSVADARPSRIICARGYRTILSGKMHFCGADQLHGFEERLTTDIYPADFGWTPDWDAADDRPTWYHNMSSVIDAGPACARTSSTSTTKSASRPSASSSTSRASAADERGRSAWSRRSRIRTTRSRFRRSTGTCYRDEDIDMPRIAIRSTLRSAFASACGHVCEIGPHAADATEQIRNARRAYYGAISYVDDQFGAILEALERPGLADDTIVIVTGDHGEMLGERGLWYKMTFFEGGCRVPLIVHAPQQFDAHRVQPVGFASRPAADARRTRRVASLHAWPDALDGRSLVPHLRGRDAMRTRRSRSANIWRKARSRRS